MIILASRSPQRRALLRSIGVEHRVVTSGYGEDDVPGLTPEQLVTLHSTEKARDVAARASAHGAVAVLGADTAVVIGDRALGKPVDRDEARRMLEALAGRRHTVLTAVCLIAGEREHVVVDATDVTFRQVGDGQMEWYLDRNEWQGRAGAYAIQGSGASLVARVDGDVTTVIGLPVARLVELLESLALAPWSRPV